MNSRRLICSAARHLYTTHGAASLFHGASARHATWHSHINLLIRAGYRIVQDLVVEVSRNYAAEVCSLLKHVLHVLRWLRAETRAADAQER